MKTIFSIIPLLCTILCSILVSSCASTFSSSSQEIVISVPMKVNLKIDSINMGNNNEFKITLARDNKTKQLIFEADGYKTRYNVILQNKKSNWYYLTVFPFGVLFFIPPMADVAPNSWIFNQNYSFPNLRKYTKANIEGKQLYIDNVSFDVKKDNFKVAYYYDYDSYLKGETPSGTKSLDSLGVKSSAFEDDLEEILKKLNYVDTINNVFVDNINSLYLKSNIRHVTFNDVSTWNRFFFDTELTTEWSLQNIYGDTIFVDTLNSSSGQYATSLIKIEEAEKLSIKDALENSMLDFIDKIKEKKFLEIEPNKVEFKDAVKISKPTKTATNIDESMKATVTIKNKDGHGSGFFVSNDGYIITNHHVVSKNSDYTVVLNDGTEAKAKVIRSNKAIDLAIIKIEVSNDFAFEIPSVQNYKIGDEILAIGTPKSVQLGQSVSKGIVSGTRKNKGMNYLQNDIKINKGNSGGPVVSKNCQLAGVVEYKLIGQGVEGLSFSIPALDIWQSLNLSY